MFPPDPFFPNVAQSVTAVSGVSTFSTVVLGVGGDLMSIVGGRSILSGQMTLGGFVM